MAAKSLGTAREQGREGLAMEQTKRFHTAAGLESQTLERKIKATFQVERPDNTCSMSTRARQQHCKVDVRSVHCLELSTPIKMCTDVR